MKTGSSEHANQIELRFLEGVCKRCPDDVRVLKALGDLYTRVGACDKGLEVDLHLARACPDEPEVWYNLGCSHALVGNKEDAFRALARALELGYDDVEWMSKDNDLESIRRDPRFHTLLQHLHEE